MTTDQFFDRLWLDYTSMTPQAQQIRNAFEQRGEKIVNDHVAFRTLALEPIGIGRLEPHLLNLGYKRFEPYRFEEKKLSAWGYLPPDPGLPRVFLSELLVDELSPAAAAILRRIASEVDAGRVESPEVFWAGRLWPAVSWEEYQTLAAESEYAAWFAAIGVRPNHFTISVNHLHGMDQVEQVLQVVEGLGLPVNTSGGRVKGSPQVLLEQASTLADEVELEFAGGVKRTVPSCYYEFAKRYPDPHGKLFQGFVAASADKIFESTDAKRG
ncbi:hypothetical protein Pla175_10570 [Pirellulimonas nuda]|uniref:2-oxoadipate dioxygenase/decarboxylase n=1 Tax=Pirellulimonas nuda TaxID=2528009 RepID=A0A518D877_9BACT|nr:DUF1338 domain-containing protein [Pirellulimonas nuda]QDU87691.1 hypothetical protein Pla175_10570 [Pirellulimonas nuda]